MTESNYSSEQIVLAHRPSFLKEGDSSNVFQLAPCRTVQWHNIKSIVGVAGIAHSIWSPRQIPPSSHGQHVNSVHIVPQKDHSEQWIPRTLLGKCRLSRLRDSD